MPDKTTVVMPDKETKSGEFALICIKDDNIYKLGNILSKNFARIGLFKKKPQYLAYFSSIFDLTTKIELSDPY